MGPSPRRPEFAGTFRLPPPSQQREHRFLTAAKEEKGANHAEKPENNFSNSSHRSSGNCGARSVQAGSDVFRKKSCPTLSYTLESQNGFLGSGTALKIEPLDDEKALIVYTDTQRQRVRDSIDEYMLTYAEEYSVPISVLKSVAEIYDEYKMYRYPYLPKAPIFATDIGTSYYRFSFSDSDSVSFNSDLDLPGEGYRGLYRIHLLIEEAARNGEKLPGLVPEGDFDYITSEARIREGMCLLHVDAYYDNTLFYHFGDL